VRKVDPLLLWVPVVLVIIAVLAYALPRVPGISEMADQPSLKPQEQPFLPPPHSVPTRGKERQMDLLEAADLENPVPSTRASITNGKRLFTIYCVVCHGKDATGKGPIAAKLSTPPDDLTSADTAEQPDGYLYQMIRQGGDVMPGQAASLSSRERWDIVNYLRSLQKRG
jgi:mono/diheme cytochrome c family protein